MTSVNITTSIGAINIYNNTEQTINPNVELLYNQPNVYIPTKVCNTYRTIKYVTEFYKDKNNHDGFQFQCKNCRSNIHKEYYNGNKENKKEYYQRNKDKIIEQNKEFYKQNRNKISEQKKEYYKKNKDKINNRERDYK